MTTRTTIQSTPRAAAGTVGMRSGHAPLHLDPNRQARRPRQA